MKIPSEVLFDISMEVYEKYNSQIAIILTINILLVISCCKVAGRCDREMEENKEE